MTVREGARQATEVNAQMLENGAKIQDLMAEALAQYPDIVRAHTELPFRESRHFPVSISHPDGYVDADLEFVVDAKTDHISFQLHINQEDDEKTSIAKCQMKLLKKRGLFGQSKGKYEAGGDYTVIVVNPSFQGLGIGKALVDAGLQYCETLVRGIQPLIPTMKTADISYKDWTTGKTKDWSTRRLEDAGYAVHDGKATMHIEFSD